jgi:pyrimidine deaminase RibD-like protein
MAGFVAVVGASGTLVREAHHMADKNKHAENVANQEATRSQAPKFARVRP